jgi:hypothetical protein
LSFGFSKRCLSIPSYLPQHCPNKLHFHSKSKLLSSTLHTQ